MLLCHFLLFFSPLCSIEYANKLVSTPISVQYGSQTVSSISEQANVSLFNTTVSDSSTIYGNLSANGAQIADVVVNGSAYLVNCTITGSISVYGELQMQNCQVNGQISTYASLLTLDNTTASSIFVLSEQGQQTIQLQNASLINGPINFQSGKGIVNLYGSSFLNGALTGGRLIRN